MNPLRLRRTSARRHSRRQRRGALAPAHDAERVVSQRQRQHELKAWLTPNYPVPGDHRSDRADFAQALRGAGRPADAAGSRHSALPAAKQLHCSLGRHDARHAQRGFTGVQRRAVHDRNGHPA